MVRVTPSRPLRSSRLRAGLRALHERDAAVERWLVEEVAPVYDSMQADPTRAQSLDDVFGAIRTRHAQKLADRRPPSP